MDFTGLPDLLLWLVVALLVAAVVGGIIAAVRSRGRGGGGDDAALTDLASAPPGSTTDTPADTSAKARAEAPEAPGARLQRLRSRIGGGLGASLLAIFSRGVLTQDDWDELEETLLAADVGPAATDEILAALQARLRGQSDADPSAALREVLLETIDPALDRSLALSAAGTGGHEPVIVVGVNGVGKTTTVGKIGRLLVAQDHTAVMGAADTFRAAAADQLETWGAQVGVPVVRAERDGADPASVAFEAANTARDSGADVVLIDTAGRLQNKAGLMDELGKIVRVVSKVAAPVEVLLVLDATTGQNGMSQARVFGEVAPVTGIVLTKMDGSAKGGIVLAVQRELGVPVKLIGLGEGADDLAPFDAEQFVDGLLGT